MRKRGFILCIDEAGDEGIERIRPIDPDGASEFFVLAGVIYSSDREGEMSSLVSDIKISLGIENSKPIHFRDLNDAQKQMVLDRISGIKIGIVCVVSNKRNMKGYRNRRIEAVTALTHNGRKIVPKTNWFYNHLFRYLIESASIKCGEISDRSPPPKRKIKIVMSYRRGFSYIQTRNYLRKIAIESRPKWYFNNKFRPRFESIDIDGLEPLRDHQHPGLQLADSVASAVYQAIDASTFQNLKPHYLGTIASRLIDQQGRVKGFGFKFLPENFSGPLTSQQRIALRFVGYRF